VFVNTFTFYCCIHINNNKQYYFYQKMLPELPPSWKEKLEPEFEQSYFKHIIAYLQQEKNNNQIVYPNTNQIFNALSLTPFAKIKVVILGQDPYHNPGQAHGLSFSVPDGIKPPPSLVNIYKEINNSLGINRPTNNGNLSAWAAQGVLLLNAVLTVRANQPASHAKIGWTTFTDAIIKKISIERSGIIFLLWGKFAQQKITLIDTQKHHVLQAAHPSPLSAYNGFFGCNHFLQTNELLSSQGLTPINWALQ
jgi:uracil-DNA glycosylase